ncbi:MAG: HAD family hydrolase [Ilumatobacteraceae bacterium]
MTYLATADFDAILFDAGGILLLPDPTVLGPLLAPYGGDPSIDAHVRAHYHSMAVKSAAGAGETLWHEYNVAYCESIGVSTADVAYAANVLEVTRNTYIWRWPVPGAAQMLADLDALHVPIGVVSNASGQIEEVLARTGMCQVGDGPNTSVRVVVDSHHVGVAKPDPRIFDFALASFPEFDLDRIAYVGDSVTMDIGGGSAAGLHPILFDPYDDHPDADFTRIRSLTDLMARS